MGMHFGLLATRSSPAELKNAFGDVWPDHDVIDSARDFQNAEGFWQWMSDKAEFVSAAEWTRENPGTETYAVWQDGEWTVLLDQSYVLASDEQSLSALSQRFGTVLSFVVESAGGTAFFSCHEDGKHLRTISFVDGESNFEGEPLPQENGIDVDTYYMDETEALMAAFGLSLPDCFPRLDSTIAFTVVDRTDYGDLLRKSPSGDEAGEAGSAPPTKKKPWWKFW
jgi:hypothetical protein